MATMFIANVVKKNKEMGNSRSLSYMTSMSWESVLRKRAKTNFACCNDSCSNSKNRTHIFAGRSSKTTRLIHCNAQKKPWWRRLGSAMFQPYSSISSLNLETSNTFSKSLLASEWFIKVRTAHSVCTGLWTLPVWIASHDHWWESEFSSNFLIRALLPTNVYRTKWSGSW